MKKTKSGAAAASAHHKTASAEHCERTHPSTTWWSLRALIRCLLALSSPSVDDNVDGDDDDNKIYIFLLVARPAER